MSNKLKKNKNKGKADILDFRPRKNITVPEKRRLETNEVDNFISYCKDELDILRQMVLYSTENAEKLLNKAGLDPGIFTIDEESLASFIIDGTESLAECGSASGVSFTGKDGCTSYVLRTRLSVTGNNGDEVIVPYASIRKEMYDQWQYFDLEKGEWIEESFFEHYGFTEKQMALIDLGEHNAKTELLWELNEEFGPVDDTEFQKICSRCQELMELYDKMEHMARFCFIPKNPYERFSIEKDNFYAVLVPEDPLRIGIAVAYDGKQYCLCQYIDGDYIIDENDEEWDNDSEGEDYFDGGYTIDENDEEWDDDSESEDYFIKAVATTPDIGKVAESFRWMIDQYNRGKEVFTVPLSFRAYTQANDLYGRFKDITMHQNRPLNKKEQENKRRFMDAIGNGVETAIFAFKATGKGDFPDN